MKLTTVSISWFEERMLPPALCVYVYVCMHVYVYICGGQRLIPGVFLSHSLLYYFKIFILCMCVLPGDCVAKREH